VLTEARVPDGAESDRLDKVVAAHFGVSRGRARALLSAGSVYVGGKRTKSQSRSVGAGVKLAVALDGPEVAARGLAILAEAPPVWVFRDSMLGILNKPPGLPVQASRQASAGTLEGWLAGESPYRALHHRLDAAAQGLLAVALHKNANKGLAAAFRDRTAKRTYRAELAGELADDAGDWRHRQHQRGGRRVALPESSRNGELMVSRFRVLKRLPGRTLVEVELETGRTHQIRLQSEAAGAPIVGDQLYGGGTGELRLQACALELDHPIKRKRRRFELPPPASWGW